MAKRGRPRKSGAREANGRRQRPTRAQIEAADKQARLAETAQVAQQPHRRSAPDPRDPRLSTALGRFVIRHGLRSELFEAGSEWSAIYRRWRAAKGVPDPLHSSDIGTGVGPSKAIVDKWWRDMERVEAALRPYGQGALLGARSLCMDDCDVTDAAAPDAIVGLRVIAVEMGWLAKSAHPFLGRAA